MSEPNFQMLSLPDFLMADIEDRIEILRDALQYRDPVPMIESFKKLERMRGNFTFDFISSVAWAAVTVCSTAASAERELNRVELMSLDKAIDSMDRARRAAIAAAATTPQYVSASRNKMELSFARA
jgi:hypothetical protein